MNQTDTTPQPTDLPRLNRLAGALYRGARSACYDHHWENEDQLYEQLDWLHLRATNADWFHDHEGLFTGPLKVIADTALDLRGRPLQDPTLKDRIGGLFMRTVVLQREIRRVANERGVDLYPPR